MTLAARNFTLVHAAQIRPGYEKIYDGQPPVTLPAATSAPLALKINDLTRPSHEQIRLKLTAPRACVAVITESYFKFWHAAVDGQPTEVLRVDCGLMGVAVGEGTHEIVLRYRPPTAYTIAMIASLLTFLACLVGTAIPRSTKVPPVN